MSEFELKSLNTALDRLLNDGIINNEQQDILLDVYKNDGRAYPLIHEEINKLRFDDKLLEERLKQKLVVEGVEAKNVDTTKDKEKPLSLEDITDFEKDGKNYIKVHYPDDSVRIIENRTDPFHSGKEQFEEINKKMDLVSEDAKRNATAIFEESLVKSCIEVDVKDIKEVTTESEFKKLTDEQKKNVVGTLKAIIGSLDISDEEKRRLTSESVEVMLRALNKKVYIAPEENIVVICTPNDPVKDEVKTLQTDKKVDIDGQTTKSYKLTSLNETGYNYENKEVTNESGDYASEQSNEETVKSEEGELDKEMGASYKPKAPWERRKKNESAFMNLSWAIVLLGIFTVIAVAAILSLFMN